MVLPFLPPPLSFSYTPSSSETLPSAKSQAFLTRRRCPPLFATSTPYRDGGYGATIQAFLLLPGTPCLSFSDHGCLSFSSLSASSGRHSHDMTRPQKRLCKGPEVFNSRSRTLVPDGISMQNSGANFRVLAFPELAVAELEWLADDALHVQHLYCNEEDSHPRRLKTAEELHFEAIQDYHLRYKKEGGYGHGSDEVYGEICQGIPSSEALQNPMHEPAPVLSADRANIPVEKSKYVGESEDVSTWHGDENALHPLVNGLEAELPRKLNMEKWVPPDDHAEDIIIPSEAMQSPLQTDGRSTLRKKSAKADTANLGSTKSSTRRSARSSQFVPPQYPTILVSKSKSPKTIDPETSQHHSKSDNEEDVQHRSPPSKDEGWQAKEENTNSEVNGDCREEQKIRMELNKAAAVARRNMRRCEEVVLEAQGKGLSFPKLESLLVERSWVEVLGIEFQKPYMERLHQFVSQEAAGRIPIYPPPAKVFNAFNSCPFDKVKVVIIGQDPYHGPGQAMGLCFSVEKGVKLPSSLSNIFLEIESDLHCDFPSHGNLEKWAHQGVLLLNTVLTVRDHHANSHAKKGWEFFTDAAIRALAQQRSGIVFLLWGNQAQDKLRLINKTSHHILKAFHPSGISAHRGFFKCRHFSQCNQILVDQGSLPIDWQL